MLYLRHDEVQLILQNPLYTRPVTQNSSNYHLYRGRLKAEVFTIRFNLISDFNERFMLQTCLNLLMNRYEEETPLNCSIHYDVLLATPDRQSFYIWRANTNRVHFDENDEILLNLNSPELVRFCQQALNFNISDLKLFFSNSNMSIDKIIAIVFTFVHVSR